MRPSPLSVAAATVAVTLALAPLPFGDTAFGDPAPATPAAPVFAHPVTVDAQRFVGEPDDTIGQDGRIYVSGPWGVSTDTSFLWRSEDGGESFRQVQAAPGVQNPYPFRAGGDTEFQAFPPAGPSYPGESTAPTSRLYFVNQNNLDSNSCGYSDDGGRTFTMSAGLVCPQSIGADRQWETVTRVDPSVAANGGVLDHDIAYLWYDHYEVSGLQLDRSEDGVSFTDGPVPDGVSGNPGNIVADRRTGVVYMTAPGDNGAAVVYSADGGKTTHTVAVPVGASTGAVGTDFTVLAIDDRGGLDLTWSNQNGTGSWQTWFTHTTGTTDVNNGVRTVPVAGATPAQWSTPIPVTGPGSSRPDITYSVFPWIVAGDPGRVDLVYYGTNQALGYDPNSQNASWSTYMWQTVDGGATSTTSQVSEAPTHLSSICFSGIGCTGTGNRNMLDFFEVHADAKGAAVVVYNDDANSLTAAFPGGPQVMVGRQVGGPSLYASTGTLTGAPTPDTSSVTDRAGDGLYPTSDTNVPSLDLRQAGASLSSDGSTLHVSFTVADLANAVTQIPASEAGTGITYVLTWKHANDLWFAAAHVDPTGTFTYYAGRPQSVPFTGTGGPKFAAFGPTNSAVDANDRINVLTSGTADPTTGQISIDVPVAMVGGLTAADRLLQATGFSIVDRGAANNGLGDQADATPSFDDALGTAGGDLPEAGWVPALVVLAAAAVGLVVRRRRLAPR